MNRQKTIVRGMSTGYERLFRFKITVASTQPYQVVGRDEKSLMCDPKYELRPGRRERKGEDTEINVRYGCLREV